MLFHAGGSYCYAILLVKLVPCLLTFGVSYVASNDVKNVEKCLVKLEQDLNFQ